MSGIEGNALAQMGAFSRKWFPGREVTVRSMAEAVFIEKDHWEKHTVSIRNGIVSAFKG